MKRNTLKNIAGLTLIEILIGVVISSIMMAAMYTTYSVVNNSYGQVVDKAKISRSGRDIVEMLMRDIRMAGFKYMLGTNTFIIDGEPLPTRSYLEFRGGHISKSESHDPIIIVKSELGYTRATLDDDVTAEPKHDSEDLCCDKIHIVFDDFDQNDPNDPPQPYKRYKTTYYAKAIGGVITPDDGEARYAIYKTFESWIQVLGAPTGQWRNDCNECYRDQKVRDYVVDMEFIPFDMEGRKINPNEATPDNAIESNRKKIYDIRAVDIRLTFRSKKEFFKTIPRAGKPRLVKGISDRTKSFPDKYLRDSVVVTIHTRNIGSGI
tara:strand:- start:6313 stop:7275 length:963 start_codon:yes stop_codon:yes gene_type:complete